MGQKRVLVIGNHLVIRNVLAQYISANWHADWAECLEQQEYILPSYDEFFIGFSAENKVSLDVDNETMQALEDLSKNLQMSPNSDLTHRPLCHLLLHDSMSLWLIQTKNLLQDIDEYVEIYAFTMKEQWAKNVLCGLQTKTLPKYPSLDRIPMPPTSLQMVHVVILGWGGMTEDVALHTSLIAHYPNYVQNHKLRTRITIIAPDVIAKRDAFIQRYSTLFDHSYYRFLDLHEKKWQTLFHTPVYTSSREDFVDVEWEFVNAEVFHPAVQQKLRRWSNDKCQQLTLFLCGGNSGENFHIASTLSGFMEKNGIPIFVEMEDDTMLRRFKKQGELSHLYSMGMNDCGYDVTQPLLQMAKRLNYFYVYSFGRQEPPTYMPVSEIEKEWLRIKSFALRYSNIYNVMTIVTKMRTVGHAADDWREFYSLSQREIEELSAVEHNRWCVERMILGYRPPTDTERKDIKDNIALKADYKQRKVHYDLCAYNELGVDATGQNVRVYDYDLTACIPLIANSYNERK